MPAASEVVGRLDDDADGAGGGATRASGVGGAAMAIRGRSGSGCALIDARYCATTAAKLHCASRRPAPERTSSTVTSGWRSDTRFDSSFGVMRKYCGRLSAAAAPPPPTALSPQQLRTMRSTTRRSLRSSMPC